MRLARFTARLLVAAGLAILSGGPVLAGTSYKFSHVLSKESHFGTCATVFAEEVSKRTGGRITIEQEAGALGGEKAILEGIQLGTHDFGLTTTGVTGEFGPASQITDLPFLFRDYAHARGVLDSPTGEELLAEFAQRDLIGLGWGENGFRYITNNLRPVKTPEDLKGLKIRVQTNLIHTASFKAMGAEPKPLQFDMLYTAMQQGTIDGQENTMAVMVGGKYAQVQKHGTQTGHFYSPTILFVSPAIWSTLTPEDQTAVRDAAKAAVKAMRVAVDKAEKDGQAALEGAGMQLVKTIDRSVFEKAVAPVYDEFGKKFGQDKIDRIRNFK